MDDARAIFGEEFNFDGIDFNELNEDMDDEDLEDEDEIEQEEDDEEEVQVEPEYDDDGKLIEHVTQEEEKLIKSINVNFILYLGNTY